jgi:hypothetical protein
VGNEWEKPLAVNEISNYLNMIVKIKNNCQFPASPGPAWFPGNADSHVLAFILFAKNDVLFVRVGLRPTPTMTSLNRKKLLSIAISANKKLTTIDIVPGTARHEPVIELDNRRQTKKIARNEREITENSAPKTLLGE